jgi:hypothetical protein
MAQTVSVIVNSRGPRAVGPSGCRLQRSRAKPCEPPSLARPGAPAGTGCLDLEQGRGAPAPGRRRSYALDWARDRQGRRDLASSGAADLGLGSNRTASVSSTSLTTRHSPRRSMIVVSTCTPPAHAVVASIDEKTQFQILDRREPGMPSKPGKPHHGPISHAHGTTTLFAALNILP